MRMLNNKSESKYFTKKPFYFKEKKMFIKRRSTKDEIIFDSDQNKKCVGLLIAVHSIGKRKA